MSVRCKFSNIGPIKEAELSLGDLTVIAGDNNTGKTYLTHALYGLLQMIGSAFPYVNKEDIEKYVDPRVYLSILRAMDRGGKKISLKERNGRYTISISRENLFMSINLCLTFFSDGFSRTGLTSFFSAKRHYFENSMVMFQLDPTDHDDEITKRVLSAYGEYSYNASTDMIDLVLKEDVSDHIGSEARNEREMCAAYINLLVTAFVEAYLPNNLFILTTERVAISLFYKELDFTKNRLVEELQGLAYKTKEPGGVYPAFLDRHSARYAKPIKDNIDFTRDLEEIQKTKGVLVKDKLSDGIKDMVGGYYRYSNYEINFISKKRNGFKIPLYMASSSAQELSDLYFYLHHTQDDGQLLIIDEPESHLSPNNQIEMARLLVRCVNAGLKVLITTHSDYMIREFNNLIMLSSDFKGKKEFLRENKKHYGSEDFLRQEQIKGYLCKDGTLKPCEVNQYGIRMGNFDEAIKSMNDISNTLGFMLKDEERQLGNKK